MDVKTIFKRYEYKYLLNVNQFEKILNELNKYMSFDEYGKMTVRNIYYDTDSYQLIRNSIDKPEYKEKVRIRSYEKVTSDDSVFVELKKKYDGIVYKRRMVLTENEAMEWLNGRKHCSEDTQISREIDYVFAFYKTLKPKAFITYDRSAYFMNDESDFRVTFDRNILFRDTDISLKSDIYGENLIDKEQILMEIKCSGGIPLWMVNILSEEKIYKSSFSKYGAAYKNIIFPKLKSKGIKYTGEIRYA